MCQRKNAVFVNGVVKDRQMKMTENGSWEKHTRDISSLLDAYAILPHARKEFFRCHIPPCQMVVHVFSSSFKKNGREARVLPEYIDLHLRRINAENATAVAETFRGKAILCGGVSECNNAHRSLGGIHNQQEYTPSLVHL
jgi:hypothetical protein